MEETRAYSEPSSSPSVLSIFVMTSCTASTSRGPCRAPAHAGSELCYWHDPAIALRRADAASRGGRSPRRIHLDGVRPTLDTPEKIARVVESYIGGLANGRATANQVKAVTAAAHVLLEALDAGIVRRELDE